MVNYIVYAKTSVGDAWISFRSERKKNDPGLKKDAAKAVADAQCGKIHKLYSIVPSALAEGGDLGY